MFSVKPGMSGRMCEQWARQSGRRCDALHPRVRLTFECGGTDQDTRQQLADDLGLSETLERESQYVTQRDDDELRGCRARRMSDWSVRAALGASQDSRLGSERA